MKASKVFLNISSVVCFIYGALYIFSLVFIPIGIYCFIAGRRFSNQAEHLCDMYSMSNKIFKNYVIFSSIACFPLGLLSIIPYYLMTKANIKIKDTSEISDEIKITTVDEPKFKEEETSSQPTEVEETEEEKKEKLKKLERFKEKGIITEEELEQAKEQLFGNKK